MDKKYYLFVNGKKVYVSEEIYKVYWQEKKSWELFEADR